MSLLPPNTTPLERAIEATVSQRLDAIPTLVTGLWNADTCPATILPWLAWSLSVDEWNETWSDDRKRAVIREARLIHQQKGTPAAIRRALDSLGQPDATLLERNDYIHHNGVAYRNGLHRRRGQKGWATYRIILRRAVTIDQAVQIRRMLAAVQRNCVILTAIDFKEALIRRNGFALRNGSYTRGIVNTTI